MQDVRSRIEDVVVYAGAARVRRVARVEVGGAAVQVRLGGLPLALRDGSIRLAATGQVIAADARVVVDLPGIDVELPPAVPQALAAARRAVALAEAEVARLGRALGRLAALTPGGRDGRPDDPLPEWGAAVDARLQLLALRAERERALRADLGFAHQALEAARRKLAGAEDDHRRASSARAARPHELRKAVVITLRPTADAAGGGAGEVSLEYVVAGARWAPTYVARLDPDGGPATLELRAVIAQRTGEDWGDVRLSLSTAAATAWTELPELASLRIGRKQPPPLRAGWRPPPTGVEALYADWDRTFGPARARLAAPRGPQVVPIAGPDEPTASYVLDEVHDEEPTDVRDLAHAPQAFGGMPPPAPPAMPMPQRMPMPAAMPMAPPMSAPMRKSAAGGGLIGALGAVVAAPAALVAAGAGAVSRSMTREQTRGAPSRTATVDAEAELIAPADLLAYGELRLPGPAAPRRGALVPAERRDLYLAVLVQQQVTLSFDVLAIVADAERRAATVAQQPLPPGCEPTWTSAYDYAFEADARVEVPSDGAWHGIALGRRDAGVEVRHVVVPRESADVFRLARLDNPHDAPLLPGPMDVYDGRDFLLTSSVAFTPPGGAVEVGLGVDARVKVARNSRYREEAAGMLRGSLRLEHAIEVDVENLHARPIRLEVRERIPVAGGDVDDTEVEVARVEPRWEPWTPEPTRPGERRLRGGHRWRLELGAGEKRRLEADYQIKISAKHELVGGNRREA